MKLPYKDRVVSFAVVFALAGVLVALAVLQYRWSGQVSEAASDRMKANLQASMMHFRDGLARELGGIALALQFDSRSTNAAVYARQIEQWKQTSAYPDLVANVYIWKSAGQRSQFLRLNFKTSKFEPCDGPAGFDQLTQPLQEFASRAAERRQRDGDSTATLAQARPAPQEPRQVPPARKPISDAAPSQAEVAGLRQHSEASAAAPARGQSAARNSEDIEAHDRLDRTLQMNASASAVASTSDAGRSLEEPEVARIPEQTWPRRRRSGGWLVGSNGSSPLDGASEHQAMFAAFNRMLSQQGLASQGGATPPRRHVAVVNPSRPSGSNLLHSDWKNEIGPRITFGRPSARPLLEGDLGLVPPQVMQSPEAQLMAGNAIRLATIEPATPQRSQAQSPMAQRGPGKPPMVRPHLAPWFIDERIPALLRPQFAPGLRSMEHPSEGAWVIVELNRKVIQERIFPELTERYFAGPQGSIYDVAVRSDSQNELIFSSRSGFGKQGDDAGDARLALFGSPGGGPGGPSGPIRVFFSGDRTSREPRPDARSGWANYRLAGSVLLPFQSGTPGGWELLAKHRKGSLEAAVAGLRRRNLAISFGVLLVLGATMAMVMVTTRRAQRLAMLQMEFVAGVSHELRTPLAVISSAADNIADGIVSDKTKLARYGKIIRDHTRQLHSLVEQILSFAAAQKQSQQFNLVRVQPPEILDSVLRNSAEMIRNAGFTVEQNIDPNLPDVIVDVPAATHCLQNLISNAVKYGGEQRWIGIRARATGKEVLISVQDKGIGMETSEMRRIFDPFYRTPAVVAAQIHGTGLGLALARRNAEGIGGRLTVRSRLGKGSTFTLRLPCADQQATGNKETATAVAAGSLQY